MAWWCLGVVVCIVVFGGGCVRGGFGGLLVVLIRDFIVLS